METSIRNFLRMLAAAHTEMGNFSYKYDNILRKRNANPESLRSRFNKACKMGNNVHEYKFVENNFLFYSKFVEDRTGESHRSEKTGTVTSTLSQFMKK